MHGVLTLPVAQFGSGESVVISMATSIHELLTACRGRVVEPGRHERLARAAIRARHTPRLNRLCVDETLSVTRNVVIRCDRDR